MLSFCNVGTLHSAALSFQAAYLSAPIGANRPPPPSLLLGGKGGLCVSVSPLHSTGTPFARYHARLHGAALPLHDVAPQTHTSRAWAASAPRA